MNTLSPLYSTSSSLSDQERIDRIKARLSELARKPYHFNIATKPLTETEASALPLGLPDSHRDLLKQIGTIFVDNSAVLMEVVIPVPWEDSDFPFYTPKLPEPHTYLCVALGGDGDYYGYHTATSPFELVTSYFGEFSPYKCAQDSFLGVVETLLDECLHCCK